MRKRLKKDFSDIDNLERATESFMREKRKELGRSSVDLTSVSHSVKRSSVFLVLGAIFVTALVCGIKFSTSGNDLRQPQETESSVTETVRQAEKSSAAESESAEDSEQPLESAPAEERPAVSEEIAEPTESEETEVSEQTMNLPSSSEADTTAEHEGQVTKSFAQTYASQNTGTAKVQPILKQTTVYTTVKQPATIYTTKQTTRLVTEPTVIRQPPYKTRLNNSYLHSIQLHQQQLPTHYLS